MNSRDDKADLLFGTPAIAAHLGLTPRQVRHQIDTAGLPTFKSGGVICSRKASIAAWLTEQESASRAGR